MKNFEYRTSSEIEYYNTHAVYGIEWLARKLIKASGRNPEGYRVSSMCRTAYYEALAQEHEMADVGFDDDYPRITDMPCNAMHMAQEFIKDWIDDEDFIDDYAK